jgi:KipI family sensor histidine kinase inhibitor
VQTRNPSGAAARPWALVPQGDRCLIVVFGDDIDVDTGRRCAAAAAVLRAGALDGVNDIVPTFNTVALHFRPRSGDSEDTGRRLSDDITRLLQAADLGGGTMQPSKEVDIPVCYGGAQGPDLAHVATHCGLTESEVITLHSATPAYVFMLGFAPGAPYIGVHDERLAIGRRSTPRTALPAGSVAIANRQTMIYPNVSPGGRHLIGATPLVLSDPDKKPPTLLAPGDTVRFRPIGTDEFAVLRDAAA